ncbi:enoyl-CoA hydratase [Halalkalibacter oceani]|uniref:enoyl-CoA hydratase n=1 Tax=Halalkalibacter oceani TaxID=1653776 RepID=UPI00339578B4
MEFIRVAVEEKVAVLTLQRPPANALSRGVLRELDQVLTELKDQEDIHVLLLHGEGRFFAAGADIKEFTTIKDGAEFAEMARLGQQVFERMEHYPKPIIAAIHGAALGGGLELAMACHIRLSTEDAKLGLPELQLGLIPGFAGTQRLPRYVGTAKAAEMLLTSEPINGKEAKELGLVNSLHSERSLIEEALKLARQISQKSRLAVTMALELLRYHDSSRMLEGAAREAELFGLAFDSADGQEGIRAFVEKRSPQFNQKNE